MIGRFVHHILATLALSAVAVAIACAAEREVVIYSEGTPMRGFVMYDSALDGQKLPTVILSHGWGGTASLLRPEAERFARAGYLALVFDYRGWGASQGRWVRDDSAGAAADARRELREVVNPLDQAADIFSAVHFVMGEAMADPHRVGLWGTSFSGGLMAYVAARDPRIKAIVAQVASFGRPRASFPPEMLARALSDATRRARGELGYPAPGVREIGNLRGAPIRESFLRYAPVEDIAHLQGCATLIIDAEKEELFDLREHGELAFARAPEPKQRVVIPGITHYGIYTSAREQAIGLAVDWMNRHLKGTP
jgi:alpha-beta hydrolase superfamily lysophospholipase